MGETYLNVTSPEVYSKRFSDYVKQFHSDDSDDAKKDEKKHQQGKRGVGVTARNPRRMSESSLLPPINVKTELSTPTFSNGVWTFRRGNNAMTPRLGGLGIGRVLQQTESQVSPSPRKDNGKVLKPLTTMSSLNVSKSPDTLRLSLIMPTDKKLKMDKNVSSKQTSETTNPTPRLFPKPAKPENQRSKGRNHKKYKQLVEPFSIRRKIEQFKRYHEEQYLLKLQKLKQDSEIKIELSKSKPSLGKEAPKVTLKQQVPSIIDNEAVTSGDDADSGNESAFNLSSIMKSTVSRHKSAKTWRTWRDVNDSYAYTDVHKYIEDNELMTPEKADWIKEWTLEVGRAFFQKNKCDKDKRSDPVKT